MLGPSAKDVRSKYNVSTSVEELAYVAWAARRTVPSLDLGAAITSFSGLRAKPSGKDFIIRVSES
jgi:glycerol-3-phosphate dehydrogenase